MRLIPNTGSDRVIDALRAPGSPTPLTVDLATPELSVFAFDELRPLLSSAVGARLLLPGTESHDLAFLGSDDDRHNRNRLTSRAIARNLAKWLTERAEIRRVKGALPQSYLGVAAESDVGTSIITGSVPFTTSGLGLTPGNTHALIQAATEPAERAMYGA
ncbi:MAG: hypothetical protein IPK33_05800 [Gemmatimonadetes bacterium]|nr:hypothetical protein [Gemmatimonadota bacterium]